MRRDTRGVVSLSLPREDTLRRQRSINQEKGLQQEPHQAGTLILDFQPQNLRSKALLFKLPSLCVVTAAWAETPPSSLSDLCNSLPASCSLTL